MVYSAITMAASGHCPTRKAPVTATVMSALILSLPRSSACRPLRYTATPDNAMASAATAMLATVHGKVCGTKK